LFAILQKYDFPSKSQLCDISTERGVGCLRYCKSTIFQANHNFEDYKGGIVSVVCDTAKVRFSKQITTPTGLGIVTPRLFAILQKYDFPSKSQQSSCRYSPLSCCLRYCKSTIFQANHNVGLRTPTATMVVCDTAKVRFSKQITTCKIWIVNNLRLFAILQKYDFPSKSQL